MRLELFAAVLLLAASLVCGQGVDRPIDWACMDCVFEADGVTPLTIRASKNCTARRIFACLMGVIATDALSRQVFLPGTDVVENPTAERKAASLGIDYSCSDPELAVDEW